MGEVAKRSNALGSGPSPSGSRVRFSPSSLLLSLPNWRNGSAPAYGAGGCGFEPHVGLLFRYGVVGNMSGSHPVASGSIPGIGCDCWLSFSFFLIIWGYVAQLGEMWSEVQSDTLVLARGSVTRAAGCNHR